MSRGAQAPDSEWLAVLAIFGLVRASFIPPKDLRELRLVPRYRRKLSDICASQVNRHGPLRLARAPGLLGCAEPGQP